MDHPDLVQLRSLDELHGASALWDDLWQRSHVANPCARAEFVAHWVERFSAERLFRAVVVAMEGRWVAALPIVGTKVRGIIRAAGLPRNAWDHAGDLLLDPDAATGPVMDQLLHGMRRLPWSLVWFDEVPLDTPHWRWFIHGLAQKGLRVSQRERFQVGVIPVVGTWDDYWASISKKFRHNICQAKRRLAKLGEVSLDVESRSDPEQVIGRLQQGFEIEDSSWKGEAGSSVLRRGMFEYFVRQGERLGARSHLMLVFLSLSGTPIAFCYGAIAKEVFHYYKIGYDGSYAKYSPGQILLYHLLQQLRAQGQCRAVDTIGELSEATSRWAPNLYPVGQVVFAPRGPVGRIVTYVHDRWWLRVRRLIKGG